MRCRVDAIFFFDDGRAFRDRLLLISRFPVNTEAQTFAHADNITDVWYHGGMPTIGEKVFDSLMPLTVTNHVNANGVPSWTAVSDSGSLGIGSTWTSSTQQYIVGFTPEETVTLISIR